MESRPVHIDELLEHASWVRALAARLVRDPAEADDVTQEVWTAALRSPPRERTNLRGWLNAAVRSAAFSMKRGEERRRNREGNSFAPREEPGPAEFVERAQLHRELVEHVLALTEPHRSLVLARWFESLSVAESARRLHVTPRVAQLRLDEAHEMLRQRLDRQSGGRAAWNLAFARWTEPQVLHAAAAGSGGALALGGIAMATKWIVSSVVAIVIASAVWFYWPRAEAVAPSSSEFAREEGSSTQPEQPVEVGAVKVGDERLVVKAPVAMAKGSNTQAKPQWIVRGHVSGGPIGTLAETRITGLFLGQFDLQDHGEAMAAKDGSFEIDLSAAVNRWLESGVKPKELLVVADHGSCLRTDARAAFSSAVPDASDPLGSRMVFRCDVQLTTAAVVAGRVTLPSDWKPPIDSRDRSGGSIEVQLFESEAGSIRGDRSIDHTTCDKQGNWNLRANHTGSFAVIARASGLRPEIRMTSLTLGTSIEIDPIALTSGVSISGTVMRAGRPICAGVGVHASLENKERSREDRRISWSNGGGQGLELVKGQLRQTDFHATTDEFGRFVLTGLEEANYELYVADLPNLRIGLGCMSVVEKTVHAPEAHLVLSDSEPVLRLSFSIDGRAPKQGELDEAQVSIVPLTGNTRGCSVSMGGCLEVFGAIQVCADVDYEFRVMAGTFEHLVSFVPALAMSEERDVRLDLRPREGASTLVVRLLTKKPGEIPVARFTLFESAAPRETDPGMNGKAIREDGTFLLEGCTAGKFRLRVNPGDAWWGSQLDSYLPAEIGVELLPGKTTRSDVTLEMGSRIRLCAKDERGGFIRAAIELRDAQGEKLATDFYCLTPSGGFGCGWYLCEQGINDHPPLPAGHYDLKLTADGFEPAEKGFDLIQGETLTLEIPMRHR